LDGSASLDELISALIAIPGVEASCAQQIALRLGYREAPRVYRQATLVSGQ
jgi:hypothetical protein